MSKFPCKGVYTNHHDVGAVQVLEYVSSTATGSVVPPNDFGMVASIDGRKLHDIMLVILVAEHV